MSRPVVRTYRDQDEPDYDLGNTGDSGHDDPRLAAHMGYDLRAFRRPARHLPEPLHPARRHAPGPIHPSGLLSGQALPTRTAPFATAILVTVQARGRIVDASAA